MGVFGLRCSDGSNGFTLISRRDLDHQGRDSRFDRELIGYPPKSCLS